MIVENGITDFQYFINVASNLTPAGVFGVFAWWATSKLIPQLQQERREAINSFVKEMESERTVHREVMNHVVSVHERLVDGTLQHMRDDHART